MSWSFFREFITNWKTVGAVAPSSPQLAEVLVRESGVDQVNAVLEIGVGTGAVTDLILAHLKPGARYLGLDLNENFVHRLQQKYSNHDFAAVAVQDFDFESYLGEGKRFDCIISCLPWTAFPQALQAEILDHLLPWLAPQGRFVTFAYQGFHLLPAGRSFRKLLESRTSSLYSSETVLKNLPPAFVYCAEVGDLESSKILEPTL